MIESCWCLDQIHFSKMYLLLDQKEKQVKKWILTFPSPSSYLFFILFLRHYQALNFIKKPQCYEVLKKSENTTAFFFDLEGRCKGSQAVPRSRPASQFKCSYGHSRYWLRHFFETKTHVSKPCIRRPVHVSPHLSTLKSQKFSSPGCMHDVFWGDRLAAVAIEIASSQ
jgi:hypothetical protein